MNAVTDRTRLDHWLAECSPEQLAGILDLRQDVIWGAPLRGLDDLASRLTQPASVAVAVAGLPLPGMELLHALAALGPRPTLSTAAALLNSADRSSEDQLSAVRSALTMLAERALGWLVDTESVAVNPGVALVITEPLGIGRTMAGHLEHTPLEQQRDIARNLGLPHGSRRSGADDDLVEALTDPARVRGLIVQPPLPLAEG